MNKLPEPPEWGNDRITNFFDKVRENSFATFVQSKELLARLININEIFCSAIEYMNYTKNWFALFFFLKAHSSFLAAIGLAIGTQIPEAYMVLRGVVENSLYGLYIHKKPELAEIWLSRHESDADKKAVKEKFKIGDMLTLLENIDSKLGKIARSLYERTIDHGAHPNERSLSSMLKQNKKENDIGFKLNYLTNERIVIELCLKSSAQIGVLCLKILELILPERFRITGLSKKLDIVSKDF
jgi:hypothetical protein